MCKIEIVFLGRSKVSENGGKPPPPLSEPQSSSIHPPLLFCDLRFFVNFSMNFLVREVLFPSFHIALSSSSYLSTLSISCSLFFWPHCMPSKKTHNIPPILFFKNDVFSPLKPPGKSVGGALCCALWLAS